VVSASTIPGMSSIRLWADGVLLVVFAAAASISLQSIDSPTYWFPGFVAVSGTLVAAFNLVADIRRVRAGHSLTAGDITDIGASVSDGHDTDADATDATRSAPAGSIATRVIAWSLWLLALPLLGLAIPFFYASLIWLVVILRFSARMKWLSVAVSVGVFAIVLNLLVVLLEIRLPPAILTGLG
jgi:hypothetical protein